MNLGFEKKLLKQGYKYIAGVDEVGRGAWAGPLVAGAVLLTSNFYKKPPIWMKQVNDSKKISPLRRRRLFTQIKNEIIWSVGLVSNKEIDKLGVGSANCLAIERAINNLTRKPNYIVADYVAKLPSRIKKVSTKVVVDGDAKIFSIALASIMAKVYRDQIMEKLDKDYPGYGFIKNKGYGTSQQQKALIQLGSCPIHRVSYRPLAHYLV